MRALCLLLLLAACDDNVMKMSQDLSANVCHSPQGRVCGYDALGGCPADDSCNWCDCSNPGGAFACTLVGCDNDAGASKRCMSKSDCPASELCVFDPGCSGEMGRCTGARECEMGSPANFCDCDGKSFQSSGPCADRPHKGISCN
jgi:hypothetical protein